MPTINTWQQIVTSLYGQRFGFNNRKQLINDGQIVAQHTTDASGNINGLAGVAGSNAVPSAVQSLYAYAAQASATIRFLPPAYGQPTSYLVTTTPATSTTTITPSTTYGQIDATISGLTNGQAYTFTVTPVNAAGNGTTAISNSVTPTTAPTGLSAITGLTVWYDAQKETAYNNNDRISTAVGLTDWSGNGYSAKPPGSGNRPTMKTGVSGLNNLRGIEFQNAAVAGENHYVISTLTQAVLGSKCTVFASLNWVALSGNPSVWNMRDGSAIGSGIGQYGAFMDTNGTTIRAGGDVNTALASYAGAPNAINTAYCVSYAPGSVSYLYVNGSPGSGSFGYPPLGGIQTLAINTEDSNPGAFGYIRLDKLMIWNRELTAAERQAVESYICTPLGVTPAVSP